LQMIPGLSKMRDMGGIQADGKEFMIEAIIN
jgi:hypothetical protein